MSAKSVYDAIKFSEEWQKKLLEEAGLTTLEEILAYNLESMKVILKDCGIPFAKAGLLLQKAKELQEIGNSSSPVKLEATCVALKRSVCVAADASTTMEDFARKAFAELAKDDPHFADPKSLEVFINGILCPDKWLQPILEVIGADIRIEVAAAPHGKQEAAILKPVRKEVAAAPVLKKEDAARQPAGDSAALTGMVLSGNARLKIGKGTQIFSVGPGGEAKGIVMRDSASVEAEEIIQNFKNELWERVKGEADGAVLEHQRSYNSKQESGCTVFKELAFLDMDFLAQLQKACDATVTIVVEGKQWGTGFVIEGNRIVTAMHNICLTYKKGHESHWRKPSLFVCSADSKKQMIANFIRDSKVFLSYSHVEVGSTEVSLSGAQIVLLENLDVAVITVANALPNPIPVFPSSFKLVTGPQEVKARCFIIGHPVDSGVPLMMKKKKVVSMQRDNFFYRESDSFVQYFTDTVGGFSGGPVLVYHEGMLYAVAVHYLGVEKPVEHKDFGGLLNVAYNEGALLSAVFKSMEAGET